MLKKPIRCYYPGDFILPNKYDLQKAYWLARKIHEVSELIVVIGKDVPNELPGKVKQEVWNEMLNATSGESVSVQVSDKYSPLAFIYKTHEGDTMSPFALALDRETADNQEVQQTFEPFANYDMIILPTPPNDKLSGEMLEAASKDDFKTFSAGLPPEMSKESKRKVFELIKANTPQLEPSNDDEPPVKDATTNEWWSRTMNELYNKFGLTKV